MDNIPLLSIVIATKNREKYCIEAIKSILAIPSDSIQIAIADNSGTEAVSNYVKMVANEKIVYRYDSGEISSIENFNRAMALATGEYVCLIGDDDTVLPEILNVTSWAKKNNIDSFCSVNPLVYYWPFSTNDYPTGLFILPEIEPQMKKVDLKKELKRLIKNGIVNYLLYPLPKTYHGIVRRDIMEQIKEITGNFYGGLSPDIYSTIAVSCLANNHYITSVPLTIAGVCATSTTADSLTGKHSGELEHMPHLKNRGNYVWDSKVPRYYSVATVWAESGLKALSDLKENNLYCCFNKYPLLAQGIIINRKFILPLVVKKTVSYQKDKKINSALFWFRILWSGSILLSKKLMRLLGSKLKPKTKEIADVTDIHAAIKIASETYEGKIALKDYQNVES